MKVSQKTIKREGPFDINIVFIRVKTEQKSYPYIDFEFSSFAASIRKISIFDKSGKEHLLTLSYEDVLESCSNTSLAGLTVGPNAGRLPGGHELKLMDRCDTLQVKLSPNEDSKQLHGGHHHLATVNWNLESVTSSEDSCDIIFTTTQPDGLDGWPGNRTYRVSYHIDSRGLIISYDGSTDATTYLNLTNHSYWLRESLQIQLAAHKMVENEADFLPRKVKELNIDDIDPSGLYAIKEDAIFNNAFILDSADYAGSARFAARLNWPVYGLSMHLTTDAPALVVYTGDYLDNAPIANGCHSAPGCAVALEAQELWPMTDIHLCSPEHPFHREIGFVFNFS